MTRPGGRLICFEGPDGAGKTTTAERLTGRLQALGWPAVYLHKKSPGFSTPFLREHMAVVKTALWDYPKDGPIETLGSDHWLHLMVSWFSALDYSCVRPALAEGRWIVIDNWFYKFLARFMLKPEFDRGYLWTCFSRITTPTDVIFLDTSPEVAARRRDGFSPTESGALDGMAGEGRSAFVGYQHRVRAVLAELCRQQGWHHLDPQERDVDSIVAIAVQQILIAGGQSGA